MYHKEIIVNEGETNMEKQQNLIDGILALNQDHTTEKQRKVIEATIDTFAQKGFAATSTSEIAKKAGVSEGTIYRHYKTKKDLLMSIITPTITRLMAPLVMKDFDKVLNQQFDSYEDFLRKILKSRIHFIEMNLPVLKIFIQELAFHQELQEQYKKHIATPLWERLTMVIEHFQQKGEIARLPIPTVIQITFSSIFGFLYMKFLVDSNFEWDDERELDRMIHVIMNGLAAK